MLWQKNQLGKNPQHVSILFTVVSSKGPEDLVVRPPPPKGAPCLRASTLASEQVDVPVAHHYSNNCLQAAAEAEVQSDNEL